VDILMHFQTIRSPGQLINPARVINWSYCIISPLMEYESHFTWFNTHPQTHWQIDGRMERQLYAWSHNVSHFICYALPTVIPNTTMHLGGKSMKKLQR